MGSVGSLGAWIRGWRGSNFSAGGVGSVDLKGFGVDSVGGVGPRTFGLGNVGQTFGVVGVGLQNFSTRVKKMMRV